MNKFPVELHLPRYQYCGPGTKLAKRLTRGDPGTNKLDQAFHEHDIVYAKYHSGGNRNIADDIIAKKTQERWTDTSLGEKAAALVGNGAMKLESKIGMSIKKPCNTMRERVNCKTSKVRKSGGGIKRENKSKLSTIISAAKKK